MREILFRGKRVTNVNWVIDTYWIYGSFISKNKIDSKCYIQTDKGLMFPVVPETVGQYTGIKDKNGNKIFEGDTISYYCENCDETHTTNVYHVDGVLVVDVCGMDYDMTAIGWATEFQYEHELIGNIHDKEAEGE